MREGLLFSRAARPIPDREDTPSPSEPGGSLQSGNEAHIRVALVNRAQLAQRIQLILGGVARLGHDAVEHRRGMTFGEDEAVAIRPFRIGRIVTHHVEVKRHQDFDRGKRTAGMAGSWRW